MTWDHRVREGAEVDPDFEPSWEAGFLAMLHPDDRPTVIDALRSLALAQASAAASRSNAGSL